MAEQERMDSDLATAHKHQIEQEQQAHSLQQQSTLLKQQLAAAHQLSLTHQQEKEKVAAELQKTNQANENLNQQLSLLQSQLKAKNEAAAALDADKSELVKLLERKAQDIQYLQEEQTHLKQSHEATRTQLSTTTLKLQQLEQQALQHSHSITLKEQNIKELQKHNQWLTQELERKATESRDFRLEKTEKLSQTQQQLDQLTLENQSLRTQNTILTKQANAASEKYAGALEKIKDFETTESTTLQSLRSELQSQKKLADLYVSKVSDLESRNADLLAIINDIEAQYTETLSLLDEKRKECDALQTKLDEVEVEVERLKSADKGKEVMVEEGLSSSAREAGKLLKGGKSLTDLYSEYNQLQDSLRLSTREVRRLEKVIDEILGEMNDNAPVLEQAKLEYEQSRQEVVRLQNALHASQKEREAERIKGKEDRERLERLEQESKVYLKEIRDLGRQVQTLVQELESTSHSGPGDLFSTTSRVSPTQLSQLQSNIDEGLGLDIVETSADSVISERLVVFRNINELQSQNTLLRRSLRDLSARFESMENERKEQGEKEKIREVMEATKRIGELKDQIKGLVLRGESFERERDQWRRIAEGREKGSRNGSRSTSPVGGSEYVGLYKQLQTDFDIFRKEVGTDTTMLRTQITTLTTEKNDALLSLTKSNSQLAYAQERYTLLSANLESMTADNTSLRDRITDLSSNLVRQDTKLEEMMTKVMEYRDTAEQLKSASQVLSAEKSSLVASEARLIEECKAVSAERDRALEVVKDNQRMFEELDRAGREEKRRLEGRIERLDKDLSITRKQLNDQIDECKTLSVRRESDMKEAQLKIDRLTSEHQKSSQALAVSLTKQENLEQKCHDLTTRLSGTEEKLVVYQNFSTAPTTTQETNQVIVEGDEVSKQLQLELVQVKADLLSVQEELKLEKERVETFREIGRSSEEQLRSLNESYDAYKAEMEKNLADESAKSERLGKRLEELEAEYKKTSLELNEAQVKLDNDLKEFEREKGILEGQIEGLKNHEKEILKSQASAHEDLKKQVALAAEARDNYEREVLAHSASIQSISTLKEERSKLKEAAIKAEQNYRLATASLNSSKESWDQIKSKLEQELEESRKRCQDLMDQNSILHSQLENVSSQAMKLQERSAAALSEEQEPDTAPSDADSTDKKTIAELREVIKFVRRDKDILETHNQLAQQERDRLKQQNQHIQKSLDETRALLDEERKSSQETLGSERKHAELMEKINQLNILRESNANLRSQSEENNRRAAEYLKKFNEAQAQIKPLKDQLCDLKAEVEGSAIQIKNLEADNERWKARTQQILAKYERIDPLEHQQLKEAVTKLEAAKSDWEITLKSLQAEIKTKEELKSKSDEDVQRLKLLIESKDSTIKEKEALITASKASDSNAVAELETLKTKSQDLVARSNRNTAKYRETTEKLRNEAAQREERIQVLQREMDEAKSKFEEYQKNVETDFKTRETALQNEIAQLKGEKVGEPAKKLVSTMPPPSNPVAVPETPVVTEPMEIDKASIPIPPPMTTPKPLAKITRPSVVAPFLENTPVKPIVTPVIKPPTSSTPTVQITPITFNETKSPAFKPAPTVPSPTTTQITPIVFEEKKPVPAVSATSNTTQITPITFEEKSTPVKATPTTTQITPITFGEEKPAPTVTAAPSTPQITPITFEGKKPTPSVTATTQITPITFEEKKPAPVKATPATTKITPIKFEAKKPAPVATTPQITPITFEEKKPTPAVKTTPTITQIIPIAFEEKKATPAVKATPTSTQITPITFEEKKPTPVKATPTTTQITPITFEEKKAVATPTKPKITPPVAGFTPTTTSLVHSAKRVAGVLDQTAGVDGNKKMRLEEKVGVDVQAVPFTPSNAASPLSTPTDRKTFTAEEQAAKLKRKMEEMKELKEKMNALTPEIAKRSKINRDSVIDVDSATPGQALGTGVRGRGRGLTIRRVVRGSQPGLRRVLRGGRGRGGGNPSSSSLSLDDTNSSNQ